MGISNFASKLARFISYPSISLAMGPLIGLSVGGLATVAHMEHKMASVLGLGAFMITWWLNGGIT